MTLDASNLPQVPVAALIAAREAHWRRTRALTALLLLAWLGTTFGTVFYARQLAGLTLFGWPLSFYLAAQGACLIYLLILWVYARAMRRIDQRFASRIALAGGAGSGSGEGNP